MNTYPECVPELGAAPYIPKIYGFRIFQQKGSKYYNNSAKTDEHSENKKERYEGNEENKKNADSEMNSIEEAEHYTKNDEMKMVLENT